MQTTIWRLCIAGDINTLRIAINYQSFFWILFDQLVKDKSWGVVHWDQFFPEWVSSFLSIPFFTRLAIQSINVPLLGKPVWSIVISNFIAFCLRSRFSFRMKTLLLKISLEFLGQEQKRMNVCGRNMRTMSNFQFIAE